jgi:hypothetical protein
VCGRWAHTKGQITSKLKQDSDGCPEGPGLSEGPQGERRFQLLQSQAISVTPSTGPSPSGHLLRMSKLSVSEPLQDPGKETLLPSRAHSPPGGAHTGLGKWAPYLDKPSPV